MQTNEITKFISKQRLKPYLEVFNNDINKAFSLYEYNILLSESFYTAFHNLEIILRNALHYSLSKKYGDKWYLNPYIQYGKNQKDQYIVDKLKGIEKILIGKDKKYFYGTDIKEVKSFDVISNLSFGFWKSLFIHNRNDICWKPCLRYDFKKDNRKYFYKKIDEIIKLRNRIFHHERIFDRNLEEIHTSVIEIINIFSPYLAKRTQDLSRFKEVYRKYLGLK